MGLRSTDTQWGSLNKLLHWSLFLAVLMTFIAVNVAGTYERGADERTWWMMLHRSFGLTAMLLMGIWLVLRPWTGRPLQYGALWQAQLSRVVHWGLVLLVIGMPVAGLLMSQFGQREVSVFGLFVIPVLLAENKDLSSLIYNAHTNIAAPLIFVLILVHIGGSLWHHIFDKDETLTRMIK
ncbi:cytochrome b/b6 domain-containing protein [Alcanivorax sp. JB21]|uniref:cytochrome b n=1 Tax=Alcanivorax limicola TaxID=2874102 RepID=UPI001CBDB66C|nr:cytochrome b/b6 domain-containing protein [Alcanivorax limicola]MBZ2188881.1 cytochrome b/b6 domain-containing protein [Alcanivorax limicola]